MRIRLVVAASAAAAVAASLAVTIGSAGASAARPAKAPAQGIEKIKHVIVIMQENRTFDSYFGTYPGADGIPAGVCVPDPVNGGCVKPYVDHADSNRGGPHVDASSGGDVNGGRMNGFVKQAEQRCGG